jgi:hypothetical protein
LHRELAAEHSQSGAVSYPELVSIIEKGFLPLPFMVYLLTLNAFPSHECIASANIYLMIAFHLVLGY